MTEYTYEKQDNDYGLLDAGEYEVTIDKIETKELPSGAKKIGIQFRVRTDVEQGFKNRIIFEDIWKERETEFYNRKRINQLLGTQEFKDGQTFPTVQDLMDELRGCNLVANVVIAFSDYRNEDENKILFYQTTKIKPKKLGDTPAAKEDTPKIDVKEDDLPF